jgi:hypothetical protein
MSSFHLAVVDETARCVADRLSADSGGQQPGWEALAPEKQVELTEDVAFFFLAQSQAMVNLFPGEDVP